MGGQRHRLLDEDCPQLKFGGSFFASGVNVLATPPYEMITHRRVRTERKKKGRGR
jgi:hypothetical protein